MVTRFLSALIFNLARLISFLPLNSLYIISDFTAFIIRSVIGYRKAVIVQNLSRSFPEYRYKQVANVAHEFYNHFTDVFIEVIKSISMSRANMKRRFKVENADLILNYYQENRNVIGLTGHLANWEWLSIVPSLYPFSCFTLYKPLRSKIAEHLMTRIRLRFGMKLLPMANAARYIISHKDSRSFYIFIGDQSPAKVDNQQVFNFLHQPTTFFTGGAKLAKATNAAVVYISIRKVKRGYYSLTFVPIEKPADQILQAYSELLVADIRANPAHWLWSHKRWKH